MFERQTERRFKSFGRGEYLCVQRGRLEGARGVRRHGVAQRGIAGGDAVRDLVAGHIQGQQPEGIPAKTISITMRRFSVGHYFRDEIRLVRQYQ